MTVWASAAEMATTACESLATAASPGTRRGDSGGSPADSGEPTGAATEW